MIQKIGSGDMYYLFNQSSVGYSHIKNKKPCQDYSASYRDKERMIITCCDGHGGAQYIRSQIGSKLASNAVMNVFKEFDKKTLFSKNMKEVEEKIKLLILCEYNKLVEEDYGKNHIKKKELIGLKEEQIDTLRFNPSKAYGTTLAGAMLYKNYYFVISIGDTEALGIKNGHIVKLFDNSNDPAGNLTYSMCQEDAFNYLRVAILKEKELDGVILCSDGLSSPYQNYTNFEKSFVRSTVYRLLSNKSMTWIEEFVNQIATKLGVGDDVSLSFIISDKTNERKYR